MDPDQPRRAGSSRHRQFASTHWSMVVAAGHGESDQSRAALAQLIDMYWYPLYAYLRRRGHQAAEAQDLTQGFLTELLEKGSLQAADQTRGRFRSFLLASLNHYLAHQQRHDRSEKRGGACRTFSLDVAEGERRYLLEPADPLTPERVYQRRWAMTLLGRAVDRLRSEYERGGKLPIFEALKAYLGGSDTSVPYRQIAQQLQSSEGAVKVAVHRLRQRCRNCLRQEIAQTVASPADVDEELRHLFQAVQG